MNTISSDKYKFETSNAAMHYKNKILKALRKEFPTVDHIILYGSYGRNEGSWFSREGIIFPYNDFDLLMIFEDFSEAPCAKHISTFRKELAGRLNIKWVDLGVMSIRNLKSIKNSIFGYDLKYGSTVIYGDPNILKLIEKKSPKSISLVEGEILFFTRLWTFCGSFKVSSHLEKEDARFFKNQMAKAVLAAIDTILLINNKYHYSYAQRHTNVLSLKDTFFTQEEERLINWAYREKRTPTDAPITKEELERIYISVANFYKKHMLNLLSKYYRKQFHSILDFKSFYKWSPKVNLKRLVYVILKRNTRFEKVYWSNIIQMNILAIVVKETTDTKILLESQKLLKKLGINSPCSLLNIRLSVARLREEL
ncbi:MAG: nucleotidyltransferase domain-containing protein [Bacteriovoracaceae bacterium]|nr:nucleotidyltransferase domain-containing protein [Bacteriovoracaceae bacterium]